MLIFRFPTYVHTQHSNSFGSKAAVTPQSPISGSFLARSKSVTTATCSATLQLIAAWLHSYAAKHDCQSPPVLATHRTFYALCQTLFYVLIFRHRQLLATGTSAAAPWQLAALVASPLNPLRSEM